MLRSYEPPSVCGTVSGLVPPSFDVSQRLAPLCDNRAITSHSGTMLFGGILSSREDENSRGERSILASGPYIVSRSALIVASGPLIVTTCALAGDSRTLIVTSGPLIVATSDLTGASRTLIVTSGPLIGTTCALAGDSQALIVISGSLIVATSALAAERQPLTPPSRRLMPDGSRLTGRSWKRARASRNRTGG